MAERYKIYEQLGAGGVGTVFRAYDSQLKRWVAVKRLMTDSEASADTNAGLHELLRQEADSLASLRNPNIVTVFDVAEDEGGLFMVMELLEGEDLSNVLARGPLSYDDFRELVSQTLEGLLAAHSKQILHRDIKPENIKVERLPGGRLQAKIIDFGLARVGLRARKQTEDQDGNVLGSIHYMAPEQLTRAPVDERTDLYSLGCVFYEAVSGRKAFDGATIAEAIDKHINHELLPLSVAAPHVPPWLDSWVSRLMAGDPEQRPPNAQVAIEEFRAWERMPAHPPPVPVFPPHGTGPLQIPDPAPPSIPQTAGYPVAPEPEPVAVVVLEDDPPVQYAAPAPARRPSSSQPRTGSKSARLVNTPPGKPAGTPPKPSSGMPRSVLAWGGGAMAALIALWFLFSRGGSSPPPQAAKAGVPASSASVQTFRLPDGRPMPRWDEDISAHYAHNVGWLTGANGKPATDGQRVLSWHDAAPRGGDNILRALGSQPANGPLRELWRHDRVRPNVRALVFDPAGGKARGFSGSFGIAASAMPLGADGTRQNKGVTLAAVFQAEKSASVSQAASVAGAASLLAIRVNAAGEIVAIANSGPDSVSVTADNLPPHSPVIAAASWSAATGELLLLAMIPNAESGKAPLISLSASKETVSPPAAAMTQIDIGHAGDARDKAAPFAGLIAEVLVYASALNEADLNLLVKSQLRPVFFK